jgi:hypothetical protein
MVARGYDGEVRTLQAPAMRAHDYAVAAVVVALLAVAVLLGHLVGRS